MIATSVTPPEATTIYPRTFYCDPTGNWFRRSPAFPFVYIPRAADRFYMRALASTTSIPSRNRMIRGRATPKVLGKDCAPFAPGDAVYLTQTETLFLEPDLPLDYILETDGLNLLVREPYETPRLWIGTIFPDEYLKIDRYTPSTAPEAFPAGTAVKVIFMPYNSEGGNNR